jgi:hypothetical protein
MFVCNGSPVLEEFLTGNFEKGTERSLSYEERGVGNWQVKG